MRSALKIITVGSIFALAAAQTTDTTCSKTCKFDCHLETNNFEECAHRCGCPSFEQGVLKFMTQTPKFCNDFCDEECGGESELDNFCTASCQSKCTAIYNPSKSKRVVLVSQVLSSPIVGELDLIGALRNSIDQLNTPLPANYFILASVPTTQVSFDTQQTTPGNVANVLQSWQLPAEVYNFMIQISFMEEAVFKTFHFVVQNGEAHIDEYVASGKNVNNVVTMTYMKVVSQTTTIQQYQSVESCHSCWIFARCCNNHNENRGFTLGELTDIQHGLLHYGYTALLAQVNQVRPAALAHATKLALKQSSGDKNNEDLETSLEKSYRLLKEEFQTETKSEVVKSVIGLRFDEYEQNTQIQYVKGLAGAHFDDYANYLMTLVDIAPSMTADFRDYFELSKYTDANAWQMFRTIYSQDEGGNCKYICILSQKTDAGNFNFFVANMQASFKLTPDLLVIRKSTSYLGGLFSSSQDEIKKSPHNLKPDDLSTLLDYFDLIAFDRFMEYIHSMPKVAPHMLNKPTLKTIDEFNALTSAVTSAWSLVQSIFSSDSKSEIIKSVTDLGFDQFEQSGLIQKIDDLQADKFGLITDMLSRQLTIPAANKQDFLDHMLIAQYSASDDWNMFRNIFSKDSSGDCKSVTVMVTRSDVKNTYSLLIANIQQTFNLSPDIIVYRNSKSSFGGLFTSQKDEIKYVPHRLTADDMKTLLDFFDYVSIGRFKRFLGVQAAVKALSYEIMDI